MPSGLQRGASCLEQALGADRSRNAGQTCCHGRVLEQIRMVAAGRSDAKASENALHPLGLSLKDSAICFPPNCCPGKPCKKLHSEGFQLGLSFQLAA